MIEHEVIGSDGVRLSVWETGPRDAPPILLLHGWSQHHLSWSKQLSGPLSEEFRLIAPDLRGHGASDKPEDAAAYDNSRPWAEDIAAIISTLELDRPVIVGWSMGGWVAQDYLRVIGDADISGLVLVGSGTLAGGDPTVLAARSADVRADGMYSGDQSEALAATIRFVKACFVAPLSKHDLAMMVGFNMLCPPYVRSASRLRTEDYSADLAASNVPLLFMWGAAERFLPKPMLEAAMSTRADSQLCSYSGAGHAPFWERAEAFNTDLATFARGCRGTIE